MTHKADQVALKALLVLGIVALLFWFVRHQFQGTSSTATAESVIPTTAQTLASGTAMRSQTKTEETAVPEEVLQRRIARLEAEMKTKFAAQEVSKRSSSTPAQASLRTREPEIRKAIPLNTPFPAPIASGPRRMTVNVAPKRWSESVIVPDGYQGTFTFSLGRIRLERNGIDLGIFYRNPLVRGRQTGPNTWSGQIRPFSMLDKTPRTFSFDSDTRTLRFWSLESKSEDILVEFSP